LREQLVTSAGIGEARLKALEQEVADEVAEAATWAEAQPDAEPEDALSHTWAGGKVAALAWMHS
jgi:TPP-dependent pyruvate/acetoin dehydrogenase alpha subunit